MIDVVFQLLIFFIVTLKQEDILAHLDVNRPAPDTKPPPEEVNLLEIMVYDERKLGGEGFSMQGKKVSLNFIERKLKRLARFSPNMSVIIKCHGDSRHVNLIQLLNVCADAGLSNLSVFSL
jgi:biopolymer transport protein ExbD